MKLIAQTPDLASERSVSLPLLLARFFERPTPLFFSFNNPRGACPTSKGFGNILDYDLNLIIPDPVKSLAEGE